MLLLQIPTVALSVVSTELFYGGGPNRKCMGNVFHSYVECLLKYMWRNYFCRKEGSQGLVLS